MSLKVNLDGLDPRALQLRRDFDQSFAELPMQLSSPGEALLAVSVGGKAFALRAMEVNGLARGRPVVTLPQAPAGFLGLSGWRGNLLPIWDLATLLGLGTGSQAIPWQIQVSDESPWALAFGGFDGYLSLSLAELRPYSGQGPSAAFAHQAVLDQGQLRPVLELSLLKSSVQSRISSVPAKEFYDQD